ncbi:MAG: mannose-1-phosphate guanylyltransferase/mannose-6-phosphate isomerase [Burkholderiales bacterium]|nr:mannose-1-phosphate guanylyltransferase/mannose-6-phosphate isomerase [Burkholderiales bacterium]|tara:strand:+ start:1345 stop:2793 length:1449 start_codon:yes stop_codon:yes gene_type:complete
MENDLSQSALYPVILSGGSGSRLWPLSRKLHPKPFIKLSGGESLIQKAYIRATELPGARHLTTVTNRALLVKTTDEYRHFGEPIVSETYILEPCLKNTAPAVAAAALQIKQSFGSDAVMLVMAADHLITNPSGFQKSVDAAVDLANKGKIVTFGIEPDRVETGYGYIEYQDNKVLRFVEKPNHELAQEYLDSGNFVWNSGMFCSTVATMLDEMAEHCPEILSCVETCFDQSKLIEKRGLSQLELNESLFKKVTAQSFDYAVLEKSKKVSVVPCDIGWNDIGSWTALGEIDNPDEDGNRIKGDVLAQDTRDCTIHADSRFVGALGVNNLFIVDTPDALLVANKSHAQEVKNIFNALEAKDHDAYKLHRTVHRPWGIYTVLEESEGLKIKRIEVKAGASLSLQMHHHRSEHWVVVSGVATVINGESEINLHSNQSTFISAGCKHRLSNHGEGPCVIIEVQCGTYVGEDDIVRFDDIYGRSVNEN